MKKLYALLVILIVLYVGVNVSINGFNILGNTSDDSIDADDNNTAVVEDVQFPKLANFTVVSSSDSDIKYLDNRTGVNIDLQKINNSQNLSDLYNELLSQGKYTSSQVIDQNGVTTYFLYIEGQTSYDADIYFNKDNQNYKISGRNTTYENSDYFINSCKYIIDSISGGSNTTDNGKIDIYG